MADFWERDAEQEARFARGEKDLYYMRNRQLDGDREVSLGRGKNGGYLMKFRARDRVTKVAISDEAYDALRELMDLADVKEATWIAAEVPTCNKS